MNPFKNVFNIIAYVTNADCELEFFASFKGGFNTL